MILSSGKEMKELENSHFSTNLVITNWQEIGMDARTSWWVWLEEQDFTVSKISLCKIITNSKMSKNSYFYSREVSEIPSYSSDQS